MINVKMQQIKGIEMGDLASIASTLDISNLDDSILAISSTENGRVILPEFLRWCAVQTIENVSGYCSKEDFIEFIEWLETGRPDLREAVEKSALSITELSRGSAWSFADRRYRGKAFSASEAARALALASTKHLEADIANQAIYTAKSAALSSCWRFASSHSEEGKGHEELEAEWSANWRDAKNSACLAQVQKLRELIDLLVQSGAEC